MGGAKLRGGGSRHAHADRNREVPGQCYPHTPILVSGQCPSNPINTIKCEATSTPPAGKVGHRNAGQPGVYPSGEVGSQLRRDPADRTPPAVVPTRAGGERGVPNPTSRGGEARMVASAPGAHAETSAANVHPPQQGAALGSPVPPGGAFAAHEHHGTPSANAIPSQGEQEPPDRTVRSVGHPEDDSPDQPRRNPSAQTRPCPSEPLQVSPNHDAADAARRHQRVGDRAGPRTNLEVELKWRVMGKAAAGVQQ